MLAASAAADDLGRLFHSVDERAHMDRQARARIHPPPRLDGILIRSSGVPTIFLNGEATQPSPGQVIRKDGKAWVPGPDGRGHLLQVGEPLTPP